MATPQQQYWKKVEYAIKAKLTYTEKELISYYELQWTLRTHVPTIDEVTNHLKTHFKKKGYASKVTQTSVNYYLQRAPVVKALKDRGIPYLQHTQSELTQQQIATAIVMMNFADTRSNKDKLDQLGINTTQYKAWMKDPQFKNLIDNLANENLSYIKPVAITELTKKIQAGDWNAIRFYLETTGAVTSNDAPQSEQVLVMLIEVIQKHVKDPDTMIAIAEDFQKILGARSLHITDPRKELTGELVEVDEFKLEAAKKMVGF